MLIDSHCHLTDGRFDADRSPVLGSAAAGGVTGIVTIASDVEDSRSVAALVAEAASRVPSDSPWPQLWGTVGIHPHEAAASGDGDLDVIRDLARSAPGIVAIGETGLDFHYDHSPRAAQLRRFEQHVALAAEIGLPLVVHSRNAEDDTIAMLRAMPPGVVGVLHCFTGSAALLDAGLEVDWYVSFSGIVSFKKYDGAEGVRRVPQSRLLIETDAPYLAPVPFRGKRNEPAYVARVADSVAAHRGENPDDVRRYTAMNAMRFYGFELAPEAA